MDIYVVFKDNDVCYFADNEQDIVHYLACTSETGFSYDIFKEKMDMSVDEWLDNGHLVVDLNGFIENGYSVGMFLTGIDYRYGSPYYLRTI